MLEESDALLTLAEVAATFAGFAALVTLFARRRVAGALVHDLLRLRLVIGMSVIVLLASLAPVAVAGYGLDEMLVWRLSAGIFVVFICFIIVSFLSSYSSVKGSFPPDRLAVSVVLVLEVLIQISLLMIVFGLTEIRNFGLYVSALIGTLAQAAFVFLRLVESTFSNIVVQTK